MSIVGSIIVLCLLIFIWFVIPYSPLKAEFQREYSQLTEKKALPQKTFSSELLSGKPELLQRYIGYCGLIDKPMMSHSVTIHNNVDFLMQADKPMIKIQYKQVNFGGTCERIAFIDTKMAGVLPFQGLDDYICGKGRMKGVVAKFLTVFNVQGKEMNQSALVTVLAEGIVCPSFLMDGDIVWQEVDSTHLKATLTQYGITVSGVFEFEESGAIVGFYSKDRYQNNNGKNIKQDWVVKCGAYKIIDSIRRPTFFQGAWVYPQGEQVYFHCEDVEVSFFY